MNVTVALTGYDRVTDRLAVEHEIPEALVRRALTIARVKPNDDDWRDVRLTDSEAERVAHELKKKIDFGLEYFLEFTAAAQRKTVRR